jgi:hypothetical protein
MANWKKSLWGQYKKMEKTSLQEKIGVYVNEKGRKDML